MYDAFISYSRTDAPFARALERALEKYRPPKALNLPNRHLNVFRDEGDLTGSEYYRTIEETLASAGKLIVVCSPDARASQYVNDEIRRFVAARGVEHVIPILLRGRPNNEAGAEADQAFPDALVDAMEMPLATSYLGFDVERTRVDGRGFREAWYTVLANLLDRSRSEVEERDRRRRAATRRRVVTLTAVVLSGLTAATVFALGQRAEARRRAAAEAIAAQRAHAEALLAVAEGLSDPLDAALVLTNLIDLPEPARALEVGAVIAGRPVPIAETDEGVMASLLEISPDGRHLAIVLGTDWRIILWPADGRGDPSELVPAPEYRGATSGPYYRDLAFSPDGSRLAAVTHDHFAVVWPVRGPGGAVRIPLPPGRLEGISFTEDGERLVVTSSDGTVRVARANGQGQPSVLGRAGEPTVFHTRAGTYALPPVTDPEGRIAATVPSSGGLLLWNADRVDPVRLPWSVSGFALPSLDDPPSAPAVTAVAIDRHARRVLAGATNGSLRLWSSDGGPPRDIAHPYWRGWVTTLAFSPDGASFLVGSGPRLWLWPLDDSLSPSRLGNLDSGFERAAYSSDGRFVLTVSRERADVWDASLTRPVHDLDARVGVIVIVPPVLTVRDTTRAGMQTAAFTPDGSRLVTVTGDWRARVWPLVIREGDAIVLRGHGGAALHAAFSPDDSLIATVSADSTVRIRDARGLDTARVLRGHRGAVTRVAFSPDGERVASGSVDSTVGIWRLDADAPPVVLRHDAEVTRLAFSPDGRFVIAVSDDQTTRIWDAASGTLAATFEDEAGAAFSADGSLLTTDDDDTVRIRRADGRGESVILGAHDDDVEALAWSRDGARVVTGSDDGTFAIWRANGEVLLPFTEVDADVEAADFSPDGSRVALATDDGVLLFRAGGDSIGTLLFRFPQLEDATAVTFNASGSLIVVTRNNEEPWLVSGDGRGAPRRLKGPSRASNTLARFSHDGGLLLSTWSDGSVWVWRVGWQRMLTDLRAQTSACLSAAKRQEYLGEVLADAVSRFEECQRRFNRNPVGGDGSR